MVESQPSKLLVAGSIPVSRSSLRPPVFFLRRATARQASRISPERAARRRRSGGLGYVVVGRREEPASLKRPTSECSEDA